jgi:predicted transcriptional regulator
MNNPKKKATLLTTLSVRLDDETFTRLVTAAKKQRRPLSEFVRLLLAHCDVEHVA